MNSFRSWMSLVLGLLLLTLAADAQLKKRVAVSRFEDRTGSGYHSLGSGIADMLATALVKSGKFSVLERQEIERVLEEQKFGQSDLVTAQTAPKIGQILGAELFVVGAVTEFGRKESNIGASTSLFGGGIKTRKARCVIDIRLINTTTGEVISAESKEGSESSTGIGVNLQQIDFDNRNSWDDTDIGKATREAVNGGVYRTWSPEFGTDAAYDEAESKDGHWTFPDGVRGSASNPARRWSGGALSLFRAPPRHRAATRSPAGRRGRRPSRWR